MQKPVYWKVALMKYAPKSNRTETIDQRNFLDSISADTEELFGETLRDDALEKTKPQQYDPKIGSNEYDPTRKTIAKDLSILSEQLKNYYTMVSNSQYDLSSVFAQDAQTDAVIYRSNVDFGLTDNRAFLAWIKDVRPKQTIYRDLVQSSFTVLSVSTDYAFVQFSIGGINRVYKPGDLIKFTRPNGIVFYGEWNNSPSTGIHQVYVPINVYNFLQAQYPGWPTAGSFHAEQAFENNIFWGYDPTNQKGWKLSVISGRFMKLYLNQNSYSFVLPQTLAQNKWYALFVNISNQFQQFSINVWTRKWDEFSPTPQNTTDLENIYAVAQQITAEDYSTVDPEWRAYRLVGTPLVMTNIRLFDSIENDPEQQMTLLNENIVSDSQLAIIVDNALPRLRLPWIGQTK